MKCLNENVGKLITRYELGLVNEQEKKAFENHLLECDVCYQDFYAMQPVIDVMSQHRLKLLTMLEGESKLQQESFLLNKLQQFKSNMDALFIVLKQPQWGFSAVALAVVLFIFWLPLPESYTSMVQIKAKEFLPNTYNLRGSGEEQDWMAKFEKGMSFYADSAYDKASEVLNQAQRSNPRNRNILFYLGLSYLLSSDADSAIFYLKEVIDSDFELKSEAQWFLANAYLLNENPVLAKEQLEMIVKSGGVHKSQAMVLLVKLSEREQTFVLLKWLQEVKIQIINLFKKSHN